ncbi:MAG: NAD-dependent epimerase/dehydratase family protein [Actinobacteria bacterium]|nr:NAD-dependent epimerase/dehydratase family protein [Actinomycetota bacterium]
MQVAVTGVSGFVGSEVARALLDRGYMVHGTVRDPENGAKTDSLVSLDGADKRLRLFAADLMKPDGFVEAFTGCDVVMHVASPYVIDVDDAQRDLVDPAVTGTLNVLNAADAAGVKRVVQTSSVAAISDEFEDRPYTEADWNVLSSLARNPYSYSKVLAERAAWDLVESRSPSFDLVVVNPSAVFGPSLVPGLNTTNRIVADLLTGGVYPAIVALSFPSVDVRDVAEAHVRAAEMSSATGRYICSASTISMERTVAVLKENGFDGYKLPKLKLTSSLGTFVTRQLARFQPPGMRSLLETTLGRTIRLDTSKIRADLGMEFRAIEDTLVETAEDVVRWGHVGAQP